MHSKQWKTSLIFKSRLNKFETIKVLLTIILNLPPLFSRGVAASFSNTSNLCMSKQWKTSLVFKSSPNKFETTYKGAFDNYFEFTTAIQSRRCCFLHQYKQIYAFILETVEDFIGI